MDEFGTSRVSSLQGMPHSPALFLFTHHATARTFPEQPLDSQFTISESGLMQAPGSRLGAFCSMPSTAFGGINHELASVMSNLPDKNEERWAPIYQTYPLEDSATFSATCESSVNNACDGRFTIDDRWSSTSWYIRICFLVYCTEIGISAREYTPASDSYVPQSGTYLDSIETGYGIGQSSRRGAVLLLFSY
jgi:hypothetical protein